MKVLLKNGRVIDPANGKNDVSDVLLEDGIIKKIEKNISADVQLAIDVSGSVVAPGFVDMHVHFREPGYEYKEDIESGCRAALRGGFTTVACMPNTKPAIDNEFIVKYIKLRAESIGLVNVLPIGCISKERKGETLAEMAIMRKAGIVAVSDDGAPVESSNFMLKALKYAKSFDILVISHSEDLSLSKDGVINDGKHAVVLGLKGIPSVSEVIAVTRDILLAEYVGCRIHIAHVSTKGAVEAIRNAKRRGVSVTAETAPHYFSLIDENVGDFNPNAKVNPPLATQNDVEAIIEGLVDGTIDAIATDHAPHSFDDKNVPFELAANGISGLETALAVGVTYLVHRNKISLEQLIEKMTYIPANILKIDRGTLTLGKIANLVIFNVNKKWVVDSSKFLSKGRNTPYDNLELFGVVEKVIVGDKIIEF